MAIRILVVDDHEIVRTGLASMFKGSQVEVAVEATDGTTAMSALKKHNPDVVLLDVRLPENAGFAVLARIRAVRRQGQSATG